MKIINCPKCDTPFINNKKCPKCGYREVGVFESLFSNIGNVLIHLIRKIFNAFKHITKVISNGIANAIKYCKTFINIHKKTVIISSASIVGVFVTLIVTEKVLSPDNFNFSLNDTKNELVVVGLKDKETKGTIKIPKRVNYRSWRTLYQEKKLRVTKIGDHAFYGCTNITSIKIPNSVTKIEEAAFYGCSNLTSIQIPNSVTEIAYMSFNECTSLKSIEIPNSVTEIGGYAFWGCINLKSVQIPNSVTKIWFHAFKGCTSLKSIQIPNSVTEIGEWAFYDTGITSIKIPKSVTKIEWCAFFSCRNLETAYVPYSCKIGNSAFPSTTQIIRY